MKELNLTLSATAPDTIVAPVAANIAWKIKSPNPVMAKPRFP